ncbi:MAG: hypothetical protein LBP51_08355 [Deferribacteraceae bacterium]|jgi:hypothetical protein|nr:hypothetical protein [Deferribacteraceae bacterium]
MRKTNLRVEMVLENFIKNEISSTDGRIVATRSFVNTLRGELASYSARMPFETEERKYFMMILTLFHDMINTYDEEIELLIDKREKMLEHLMNVKSVTAYLNPFPDSVVAGYSIN